MKGILRSSGFGKNILNKLSSPIYLHKKKIIELLHFASRISLSLLIITLLLRVLELVQLIWVKPPTGMNLNPELIGIVTDFGAFSNFGLILLAVGIVFMWNKYIYKIILHSIGVMYIFICMSSVLFFITALVPLDQSIFTYSIGEITETIKSSQIGAAGLGFILISLTVYLFVFRFTNKIKTIYWLIPFVFLFGAVIIYPFSRTLIKKQKNLLDKNLALSKADYFIYKSYRYFKKAGYKKTGINSNEINLFLKFRNEDGFYKKASAEGKSLTNKDDIPEIAKYPLLHHNTFNPLDDYFLEFTEKPNIVLIIMESLGSRFLNSEKDPVCFVPFLDSLKNESLYWENCFSTSERTFGVLPSVLGSLPYGNKGFSEMAVLPEHLSITSLLKESGYYTSFFYGGWTGFGGMNQLLIKQRIDYLSDYYSAKYKAMEKKSDGFAWGYPDGEMIKRSFEVIDNIKTPLFNLYLTLSSHGPFSIPEREKYLTQIEKMLTVNNHEKNEYITRNIDPYISMLYADDCLRGLFEGYKKDSLYKNTIFIITGDHHMHELGAENALEIYHVPLIIHSALLKKSGQFKAVIGHHDIAPSLINLLGSRGILHAPKVCHWLGYGLETNNNGNNKFLPLMQNNKEIGACIFGNYFYSENKLYRFKTGECISPVDDNPVKINIEKRLDNFRKINNYVSLDQYIIPIKYTLENKKYNTIK